MDAVSPRIDDRMDGLIGRAADFNLESFQHRPSRSFQRRRSPDGAYTHVTCIILVSRAQRQAERQQGRKAFRHQSVQVSRPYGPKASRPQGYLPLQHPLSSCTHPCPIPSQSSPIRRQISRPMVLQCWSSGGSSTYSSPKKILQLSIWYYARHSSVIPELHDYG